MYKVVLADDNVPLLDYLSASIPWGDLGLTLAAACADGEEAFEACQMHHPDILITDIGMPIMNGLELLEKVRISNPQLKTIILSCHEDFQYAQKAVKLHVSEYVLKESLQIDHLIELLRTLIAQLNEEKTAKQGVRQLQDVVKQNRSVIRTTFLRSLLEQPVMNEAEWIEKAAAFHIHLGNGSMILPVLVMPERALDLESRFGSTHLLQFVLDNTLSESILTEGCSILTLDERHAILLFPFTKTLKRNMYEDIRSELHRAQQSFRQVIRIELSMYLGDVCDDLPSLKKQIQALLNAKLFRFYAGEQRIVTVEAFEPTNDDLFIHYIEAVQDFRACIQSGVEEDITAAINKWFGLIQDKRYPVDTVRSWMVNLVMELELKYIVMQHFVSNFKAELLHQTIYQIVTLDHLREWTHQFLLEKRAALQTLSNQSVRKEIAEAKRHILLHLGEKISMEEMAGRLNLNPSHFSRLFKKETGETFVEFVNRSKMECARDLLDKSDASIEQIAEKLGFEHTSYFIKLFRSFSSKSPAEFRRRM
ncbi:helix-turn-helix domain-containing protein [Paenibacillus aceris]|uniref:Two-component system response regulator YesN n=1 Tax=Paenibacillus aceris TaxID=869555 RepID=A0ABS4I560_9BACL|nr:helix-turn-helix domain-containing protein [Paenibacillus aceris]MBP1965541.1 two-component system response regulator YesN [Paenibacillus aceris]NHW33410.1 helix-turn-helix domain-containing protein [Paenibacillus aceris]